MDLFLSDEEYAKLDAAVVSAGARAGIAERVALAWHLRERDSGRARRLAEQALAELSESNDQRSARLRLRLQLLLAECHWLFAQLDLAEAQARTIIPAARTLSDVLILADAHLLLAHIAGDRGDLPGRCAELDATAAMAVGSGDDFRMEFAQLCIAHAALRQNIASASAQWGAHVRDLLAKPVHPALHVMCNEFLTFEALQTSDFATVFRVCSHTVSALKRAGMVRQIALSMTMLGVAFANLNDDTQALEWMQRSLELARPTGWPLVLGNALLQVSSVQRSLGQFEAAQAALDEALPLLAPLQSSRTYALGLVYMAELQRDLKQPAAALEAARQFDAPSAAPRPLDLRLNMMAVEALSLSKLGRPHEALVAAHAALQLVREADLPLHLSDALQTLATLYSQHDLPAPPDMQAASPSLHYLLLSLAAFSPEQQSSVPPSVFDAIAAEYAKLGDHAQAYAYAQKARAASEAVHKQDVSKRLILLETKFHTERGELLSQTSATLERLSQIGQEITGHLQEQAVYDTLDHNVHGLLRANHFSVYLLDAAGENLLLAYGAEDGRRLASFSAPMSHPTANIVRCAAQRREVFIEVDPSSGKNNPIPGTLQTLSAMFMPLISGEQLLGVMSIQSTQAHAYADRERLIFRSLAAYGAIAIDNAQNYRRLEATLVSLHQAQAEVLDKNQELERAYQSLKDISLTDPLTGLRNRRFLEQNLAGEISQCLRHYEDWRRHPEQPAPQDADLIFLLVDIDHFKRVNDDWGHPAGDAVLVQMRARLQQACRDSDYLVRWGGEEFLVVARATNASAAPDFAERIRAAVAQQPFDIEAAARLALTCSVGFATLPFVPSQPERLDWQQVVGLADQALYMAKRSGRNTWVGLSATAQTPTVGDISELLLSPQASANAGWLRIESMRPMA
ncbi:sensor domain-containing diguanylate cyclase [Paucibacter sp. TC2R-5]|uniref:diguanylate cyclase domain-containing protein n=1 Tax=Paucibacter sp. TC2R-5 TaxID=2893555 RepID=UPI0021E3F080|nr:sensor domain-containing diguanylate cyclase [Paucibacter sp. TC2R-5]MCV2358439.1 sensor domain-containing diguanylate cyclase [Paucibacter sp. TC2R-5]